MEGDVDPPCVAQSLSGEVTDEPHGNEMTFDYLDMIESLQHSLDIPTIKKLCEYFNMTRSLGKIKASDNPQHHFLLECRRKCIITWKDTTKLLEAFRETGLSNLQRIIEDYNQISNCPDVRVTVNNDNPTSAFSSFKTFMLSKKRAIKSVFTRDKGIHLVDCQEGSLVICLKVSSVEELDKLKEYIESGELLRRLMARYESEISDTERKDFQSESSSIKLSYDTEEFENAKQQLTTNNARFCRSIAITKSVTQTRTETTILQEEMEVVFDPPSVVQSISEEEETQTRIEATTSQEDMEEYFDAHCDVVSVSEEDTMVRQSSAFSQFVTSEDTQTRIEATTSQEDMQEYFDALSDVPSLSEKDANVPQSSAPSQSVTSDETQTRMEATTPQEDMQRDVDPPCVVSSLSGEDAIVPQSSASSQSVTLEETQTGMEATTSQEDMQRDVDPPSVVSSLSGEDSSFRRSIAITKYATQTRIETSTFQEEMIGVFHPPKLVQSQSEQDDGDSEKDFLAYLDEVGLKEYFPRKLTMKEATEIRLFPSDESQIKKKDIPFLFISKLTSLDSRITWKENLHIDGSVRDFIYAILHCSDNHLRQHLLEKFASCQLAVPVLLPGIRDGAKPELLTWAISRVVKKWKDHETSFAPEKRMVSEPVFTTAFIRFGDIPISKSSVLNNVIGRSQGNGEFHYFLSYENEKEYVYNSRGSVEAQWYLPIYGRKEDLLNEVTLLLNLRGDSTEFATITKFLYRIVNAIFIFVDKSKLECYKTAIDDIKTLKNVFVIHVFSQKEKQGNMTRRQQLSSKSKTLNIDENDYSADFGVERNVTELAKIICKKMVQYCNNTSREDYCSIEDWQTFCSNEVTVDQDNDSYKRAKQLLQSSFPKHESIEKVKQSYLQLQVGWCKWVEADKKPLCVGEKTVADQFEAKDNTKRNIRRGQRENGLSEDMIVFFESLQKVMSDENDALHYFMSFFQTKIETIAAREIPPLIKRIDELNTTLLNTKSDMKQTTPSERSKPQNEIEELQQQLLELSKQVNAKHISCEHFIRELGHLYEANLEDTNIHERNELLVNVASKLLLAGYPLELLDGENAYIPIQWISGVLEKLAKTLNNPRIFVLSIIGIQSSGKSTLLNSMFGVRFPVRAGRCTRGLYLQLLEVNKAFHEQLGFKYLLIIDTEGLHSPDRTVLNDHTFDNSVATLAMCIGDLTLLNVGQETIGPDMIGILQIVVHALIRMKKVKLVTHCRIIQQRVSDIAAVANNKTNMTKIKDALNKVTRIAAAEEKVDHIQDFSDVFPLAAEDDLQFFPCLWMGLMSPPNSGYSDKIHALKDAIFKPKLNQPVIPPQFTMTTFVKRLGDVWHAVRTEDFVFNFQNSLDALSNQRFRLEHNKLIGKMRTEIFQWELSYGINITNATKTGFYRRLENAITHKCQEINKKIDEYVKAHSDEEEVRRRHESIKNETIGIGKDIERSIRENTEIQLQNEADIEGLPKFIRRAKEELKTVAKEAANQIKRTRPTFNWKENHKKLDKEFDALWDMKSKQLEKEFQKNKITEEDIEEACDNSLRDIMIGTEHSKAYSDEIQRKGDKTKWRNFKEVGKDFAYWVGRQFQGSKVGLNKVQNELTEIVNRHEIDFINQAKVKPFQQSRVETILREVYLALTQSNINSELVVRTLRAVQNDVCTVCKDCQRKYETHNSLQRMFEIEKEYLKEDFKGFVDETIKSGAAVRRSYSECVTVMRNVTLNVFNVKLLAKMREEDCYNDKQRMLGRILEELCLKKDSKLYHAYIRNNGKFVSNWLTEKVITEITARSQYWVKDVIDSKINEILGYVQSALRKTKHELTERGGEQITTFDEWANTFLQSECISEYGRNIQFSVEDFNITDIAEFTDMLETMFRVHLKTDITKEWDLDKLSDSSVASRLHSQMRDVASDILDHLGTCKEVCPFCRVPCHLQNRGEHKHTAIFHYSQGVAGATHSKSRKLVSESCTMLVASDDRYRKGSSGEYRPYKEYAEDYPSWDIPPITGSAPIIYWKWVLQTFNDDFAKLYHEKSADLSKEWGTVSEEDALSSLRLNYHLTEP